MRCHHCLVHYPPAPREGWFRRAEHFTSTKPELEEARRRSPSYRGRLYRTIRLVMKLYVSDSFLWTNTHTCTEGKDSPLGRRLDRSVAELPLSRRGGQSSIKYEGRSRDTGASMPKLPRHRPDP
jgi:hypothetical protein